MTSVNVNGAIAERMTLDPGAAGPFLLFEFFRRRHPEALPRDSVSSSLVSFTEVGAQFTAERARLGSVTIGNVAFKDFTGYVVASQASYSFDADGVIGPDFLHFFDVHLDYPNGTIHLVPNASGNKAMHR